MSARGGRNTGLAVRGRRAGIVSRGISVGIDWIVVEAILVGGLLTWGLVQFLWTGHDYKLPSPSIGTSATLSWILLVIYLAVCWSGSGRTVGQLALGLRTLTDPAGPLLPGRALARALLCATVGPVLLLWIIPSRKNAAIQDLVCRTTVVYDWH
jgi:uncharacterized RDD family membrane protein YckC